MARKKLGRPTSMTEDTLSKLKEAFLMGCTDTEACLFANDISPATLYKYQEENPVFSELKAQWKQNPIVKARTSVLKGIAKNPQLALSFLERKLKNEFSLRQEVTGKDGKDLVPSPMLGGQTKDAVPTNDSDQETA